LDQCDQSCSFQNPASDTESSFDDSCGTLLKHCALLQLLVRLHIIRTHKMQNTYVQQAACAEAEDPWNAVADLRSRIV